MNDQYTFDLVDEPWIPCLLGDGSVVGFGLRQALAGAHEIRGIVDPSPLITLSLHRLLLAILHRNFGPAGARQWRALWVGAFDTPVLAKYFERWRSRFDLFGGEYPFYQWPGLSADYAVPIAKLTHELASGNNATLFDHTIEDAGRPFSPAAAARYVVAQQSYAVGGLLSYAKNEPPATFKSAAGAPLVRGGTVLVRGESLFHTLMLNLQRYDTASDEPFATRGEDRPAWERPPPAAIEEREPRGYLEYLTWQSRRIRLLPERAADGGTVVQQVVIMKGHQFPPSFDRVRCEQHQAFRKLEKPAAGQEPWQAVGFREDRSLWRDSLAFVTSAKDDPQEGAYRRPSILQWLSELADAEAIPPDIILPLDVLGLSTDKAKVLLWRQDRLDLPLAYVRTPSLCAALALALPLAEQGAKALYEATGTLAALLQAPGAEQDGGRQAHKDDVRAVAESMAPGRLYWPRLEQAFRALLYALPDDQQPDLEGEIKYGGKAVPHWKEEIRQAAGAALASITRGLDGSARNLRAVARAERVFARAMIRALGPIESKEGKGAA